jgi:hypothetical protein
MDSRLTGDEQAAQRFHALLRPMLADPSQSESLPSFLTAAAQQAMRADGAGLSIVDSLHRVPIGGSTTYAISAERLQFTVGVGPCLDALTRSESVRVDADQMRVEWPSFYSELEQTTPYRSVVAVPMTIAPGVRGALDVYYYDDGMPSYAAVSAATTIAVEIASLLTNTEPIAKTTARWDAGQLPDWVYGPQSRRRLRTWVAVGVLVTELDVDIDTALTRLRAYSYAHDVDIDQVTDELIDRRLPPSAFR